MRQKSWYLALILGSILVLNLAVVGIASAKEGKLGIWLWYLPDTKFASHTELAAELKDMGVDRIYVKVNDEGNDHYFAPCLDEDVVEAYKNKGLEVWAWAYNYPHSFAGQVEAFSQAAKVGYDGYAMDVEAEFEEKPDQLKELAVRLYNARVRAVWSSYIKDEDEFPIYLSSFGNIMDHGYIRIGEVDQYVDGYLPQTYLEKWGEKYMENPQKWVAADKEDYRQAGATKPIHNVISVEYGTIASSQVTEAFAEAGAQASIWRIPRWNVDTDSGPDRVPEQQWNIIKNVDWNLHEDSNQNEDSEDQNNSDYNLKAKQIKAGNYDQTAGTYQVKAVIRNESDRSIRDFSAGLWIGGDHYEQSIASIEANSTREVVFNTDIEQAGSYNASLLVDNLAQVKERNEDDNKIEESVNLSSDNEDDSEDTSRELTVNYPADIIKNQEIKISGQVPNKAAKVTVSVDGWPLTNRAGEKKIEVSGGKYELYYTFQKAQKNRKLTVRAYTADGNQAAKTSERIDILVSSNNSQQPLTVSYPQRIIAGQTIAIKGQAPLSAEKVIISVDGWPLTNEAGEKNIKVENGSYKLEYSFSRASKNRQVVVKAFNAQGEVVAKKSDVVDISADQPLTINCPDQIETGTGFTIEGQALDPIYKVIVSVDGYKIDEQPVKNNSYQINCSLNTAGVNRKVVVNAFNSQGLSVNEKIKLIDVGRSPDSLGAEFANYADNHWSTLIEEADRHVEAGTLCVAFVSAALRQFGYDIDATVTDGRTNNQTKEDTLVYNLFKAGFKKSTDPTKLSKGDICFTEPQYYPGVETCNPYTPNQRPHYFPNHAYIFMSWVNPGSTKYAWVVDNQGRRHKRNMTVSGEKTEFGYFMYLPD